MNQPVSPPVPATPFELFPFFFLSEQAALANILPTLSAVRVACSPDEFRADLRALLLAYPTLTLRQVALALGCSPQRVSRLVGPLSRPHSLPHPPPSPALLSAFRARVATGEPAAAAARSLGLSISTITKLGFRSREVRPVAHGAGQGRPGCGCWRCRRAAGVARPRAARQGTGKQGNSTNLTNSKGSTQ